MATRTAQAQWEGTLTEGRGTMAFDAWQGPYSFASRFEEGEGTNPEELIAAAHAGCFSMALAGILAAAGRPATSVRTTARVHINKVGEGFGITKVELDTQVSAPGMADGEFQQHAQAAKLGCPVSKALAAVPEITLQARLV